MLGPPILKLSYTLNCPMDYLPVFVGQSTDGVDSGMSSAKTSAGAPLQPSDMSLFDPLAVQVELRHPERLRCQDSALGAEGGEEDVTPTGTQATPSPSGGSGLGRSGSASPARRDRLSPGGGTSPTPDGMQSLGRLSLAVKELPEEEALLLLQGDEETAKAATGGASIAAALTKGKLGRNLDGLRLASKLVQHIDRLV